jgi:hypothetical protein
MVLVACATITRGTTQVVAVDTPGAPGTSCTIQTQKRAAGGHDPGISDLFQGVERASDPMHEGMSKRRLIGGGGIAWRLR